jgi:predicted RNA binding protein YcfA (HicA-like mRNA interferase family)
MPKLPSISPQQVARALERAGFILKRTSGSHFIYYHPETVKKAIVPIHKKDMPKGTLCKLLKDAGIEKDEFNDIL